MALTTMPKKVTSGNTWIQGFCLSRSHLYPVSGVLDSTLVGEGVTLPRNMEINQYTTQYNNLQDLKPHPQNS